MLWVIPIGGKGTRTQSLGEFKPFIEIEGLKILEWFLISIKKNVSAEDSLIFITTEYYETNFAVKSTIENILNKLEINNSFQVLTFKKDLPGVSATIYSQKEVLGKIKTPIVVIFPDQYIDFSLPLTIPRNSCFLPIYAHFGNKSGFVEINNGLISKFVEKENVSNLASAGAYILPDGKTLVYILKKQFENKLTKNGEYYFGPALNYLIEKGYRLYPLAVSVKYDLGNIQEIYNFANTPITKSISKIFNQSSKASTPLSSYQNLTFCSP
ncbi:MAG: sugar phosphate nucleotidyltransferase [Patescibacteria group bacterium]|jgi:NDP-sugar pyrophosphorylase family protein